MSNSQSRHECENEYFLSVLFVVVASIHTCTAFEYLVLIDAPYSFIHPSIHIGKLLALLVQVALIFSPFCLDPHKLCHSLAAAQVLSRHSSADIYIHMHSKPYIDGALICGLWIIAAYHALISLARSLFHVNGILLCGRNYLPQLLLLLLLSLWLFASFST